MFVRPSIHGFLAWSAIVSSERIRRHPRRPLGRTDVRPLLEGLEDRCLLSITEFPIPNSSSYPTGIAAGPDGNLWFLQDSGYIGMINPTNYAITEFPVPGALAPTIFRTS